jgi:hypothetical protein
MADAKFTRATPQNSDLRQAESDRMSAWDLLRATLEGPDDGRPPSPAAARAQALFWSIERGRRG